MDGKIYCNDCGKNSYEYVYHSRIIYDKNDQAIGTEVKRCCYHCGSENVEELNG